MSQISIGVDVGSTSIKAIALDAETRSVLQVVSVALDSRVIGTPAGHYEEAPLRIRSHAFALIRDLAATYGDRIQSIAFTGQMHSGMFIDVALNPVSNLVTWQDKRGDERDAGNRSYVDTLRESTGDDLTGVGIHTGFLAATALWFAKHGTTLGPGFSIIGIYDWLTSLLVGRAVTDITSAAAWGLYDIVGKIWKTPVLEAAQIPLAALPEAQEPGALLGRVAPDIASELNLPKGTRVHSSIGDTQASFLGSGVGNDEILLNFGTGSQSMWRTDKPAATYGTDIRYLQKDRYIVTAPTLAGGKGYQILAEFYGSVLRAFGHRVPERSVIYDTMNRIALTADSEAIRFDPIFAGSRWKEPSTRASIEGLDASNFQIGPVTRALLEGMIDEVAAPYFMREKGGLRHRGLVGAGNGMRRNAALRDAAEKRFMLPLRLAESDEEAARGAALLTLG